MHTIWCHDGSPSSFRERNDPFLSVMTASSLSLFLYSVFSYYETHISPPLRIINILAAIISASDVLCMGLAALSECTWIEYLDPKRAELAVVWIQLAVLCGECSECIAYKKGGKVADHEYSARTLSLFNTLTTSCLDVRSYELRRQKMSPFRLWLTYRAL